MHAVSVHYLHYNFTPAIAAGKPEHPWTVWDIAGLLD